MPYFGVCYSPYHRTNSYPPYDVSEADVDADMAIIKARGFTHIRTYSAASGDRHNVDKAGKYGLKVVLGVWIQNNVQNNALVDEAVSQAAAAASAYRGANTVVDLVIGNEVNRKDGKDELLDPDVILNYMRYAKEQLKKHPDLTNMRVTTCFSGTVLQDAPSWENVVDYCDSVVYLTVYPWYGNAAPDNITDQMDWSWNSDGPGCLDSFRGGIS